MAVSRVAVTNDRYKKPKRPCVFCGKMESQLRRHLLTAHRHEERIAKIKGLPRREANIELDLLRKEGIFSENVSRVKQNAKSDLIRERNQGDKSCIMCSKCKGFFSRSLIWKHARQCTVMGDQGGSVGIELNLNVENVSSKSFHDNVLQRLREDTVGRLCKTDATITKVGKILWERSGGRDRRSVMGEMRKLGILLEKFKIVSGNAEASAADMLETKNFRHVVDSINQVSANDDSSVKGGLKISLGYLLKKAARFSKSEFIIDGKADKVSECDNFLSLLDSSWGYIF